jgi:hypothetical protein
LVGGAAVATEEKRRSVTQSRKDAKKAGGEIDLNTGAVKRTRRMMNLLLCVLSSSWRRCGFA